jgi:hypothetical protein
MGSIGDAYGVTQMITMSVRYQDIIGLNLIGLSGCQRVVSQKGIGKQTGLLGFD